MDCPFCGQKMRIKDGNFYDGYEHACDCKEF